MGQIDQRVNYSADADDSARVVTSLVEEIPVDQSEDLDSTDAPLSTPGTAAHSQATDDRPSEDRSEDRSSNDRSSGDRSSSERSAAERSAAERSANGAVDPDGPVTRAFLAGSEQAFLQLYAKYEAPLLLYCKRMLANDHVAEDAFQDLWIKVFELRNRDVTIVSFRALLFRSARNLCLNMLRLEKSRAGSSDRLVGMLAPEDSRSHEREIKSLLRQALARVPFNEREAFVMHEYSGYSYAEIAEIMKTNEANVKVRAYRARTRLRKLIQGWLGLAADGDPLDVI